MNFNCRTGAVLMGVTFACTACFGQQPCDNLLTPTIYSINGLPDEVVRGDFDGDGQIDLVLSTRNGSIQFFQNCGTGPFCVQPAVVLRADSVSRIAAADMDGDGISDLITTTQGITSVRIFWGNSTSPLGSSTLHPVQAVGPGGATGPCLALADFNVDGKPDVVVGVQTGGGFSILRNLGQRAFDNVGGLSGWLPNHLAMAVALDVNWDGYPDIAALESGPSGVVSYIASVFINNHNLGFSQASAITVAMSDNPPKDFKAIDVNGDGHLDVVAVGGDMRPFVTAGTTTLTWYPPALWHRMESCKMDGKDWPWGIASSQCTQSSPGQTLLVGGVSGQYFPSGLTQLAALMWSDLDGDAANDLVVAGTMGTSNVMLVYRSRTNADVNNDGFIDFTDFDAFVSSFEAGSSAADFNKDGFIDFTDFDQFVSRFELGC